MIGVLKRTQQLILDSYVYTATSVGVLIKPGAILGLGISQAEASASSKPAAGSAWNAAGTWEEKDAWGPRLSGFGAFCQGLLGRF